MKKSELEERIKDYNAHNTLRDVMAKVQLLGPNGGYIHHKANVLTVLLYEADNLEDEGRRYASFTEYKDQDRDGYKRSVDCLIKAIKMGATV